MQLCGYTVIQLCHTAPKYRDCRSGLNETPNFRDTEMQGYSYAVIRLCRDTALVTLPRSIGTVEVDLTKHSISGMQGHRDTVKRLCSYAALVTLPRSIGTVEVGLSKVLKKSETQGCRIF